MCGTPCLPNTKPSLPCRSVFVHPVRRCPPCYYASCAAENGMSMCDRANTSNCRVANKVNNDTEGSTERTLSLLSHMRNGVWVSICMSYSYHGCPASCNRFGGPLGMPHNAFGLCPVRTFGMSSKPHWFSISGRMPNPRVTRLLIMLGDGFAPGSQHT